MSRNIRVTLIEDDCKYRDALSFGLDSDPSIDLISQFGTIEFALKNFSANCLETTADVVLLDLYLPCMSGREAIPDILAKVQDAKIIVLTQSDKQADVLKAIQLGASGYLLKSSSIKQIIQGIHVVFEGGASLDWSVAHFILEQIQNQPDVSEVEKLLSKRELEILVLLSKGRLKKEIADKLGISYGSVATYIRRIYEKLQAMNAAEAVSKAHQIGLLPQREENA